MRQKGNFMKIKNVFVIFFIIATQFNLHAMEQFGDSSVNNLTYAEQTTFGELINSLKLDDLLEDKTSAAAVKVKKAASVNKTTKLDPFAQIPEFTFDYKKPEKLVYSIRKILHNNKIVDLSDTRINQLAKALSKTGIRLCEHHAPPLLHVASTESDALTLKVLLRAIKLRSSTEWLQVIVLIPNLNGRTSLELLEAAPKNDWYEDAKKLLMKAMRYKVFKTIQAQ